MQASNLRFLCNLRIFFPDAEFLQKPVFMNQKTHANDYLTVEL